MKKLKTWIIDYAHMLFLGAIMYLRHTPPKHYLEHVVEGKIPVIILPGVFGRWAFMKPLGDHISLLGHPVYIVPKLGNNLKDIPTSAKKVYEVIEENNLKNVVIVAHSKGGLIGKYLMAHEDKENRVKGLIAIATPFHGSRAAKLIPHPGTWELSHNSEMIKNLESQTEVNKKIVSIIPLYDNHVWHSKGSFLEGAKENIQVEATGHHKVAADKKVWESILEEIDKFTDSPL